MGSRQMFGHATPKVSTSLHYLLLGLKCRSIYPNSSFIFLDMEDLWPAEVAQNSKHLIHARMAAGSIVSWPQLYTEAFR